ncbi:unnamed protein product [Brachionus calyciflorus]|uniref:Death domain-containing protein n=1 Tax=Brachionus calyciflorus TaxID=104777 RepID=A0A813MR37_9BILA|nr:unnamed protein product [Brachionus calyciflorus]
MGAYRSVFEKNEEEKKINLSPSKGDWITGHADLTGLAVVEVQRLWIRFNQLGCDAKGYLPKRQIERGELSRDIFMKNIISNIPKEKDGSFSFLVFLKFMQWVESADLQQKLKYIFNFLNNGDDLNLDIIDKLLRKLYPNSGNNEIKDLTEIFMNDLDPKKTGKISEKQFVNNILSNYDESQLNSLLKFELIPDEALREANMQPSLAGSQLNMRNQNDKSELVKELDDDLLGDIAIKAGKKDWEKLASKLGYSSKDIQSAKSSNNGDPINTIYSILLDWRDQDPYLATKDRLKGYLVDSRMPDVAALLK